jgi:hypothetical protein
MALFDEAIITYDASTENFFPGDIMKNTDLQARKNAATPRIRNYGTSKAAASSTSPAASPC